MPREELKYRAMGKADLAEKAGVSFTTFRRWINKDYYTELAAIGYSKKDKLLKPHIVKYLCEKLVISFD